ncbi:amine oxidase [Hymenobacter roseosalivarius DSM 11622]|uniref:Amine oxidase n=1 Tax=Hymenobacter roseosalivarius DSM 11622 TaxID=645990 RepID=A0A1W1W3V8_9BACT|nr:FAD-dependent oxidoreductase [Hymenobacter roseosalivarius]SMC00307.1 amine oxidase [Hymenobacter roseosalivarius DSM 11622]
MPSVLIIGAGLAGLMAAYTLQMAGVPVRVLEARDRVGGRTWAVPALSGSPEAELIDLGATWGWAHHPELMHLLPELGIRPFEQHSAGTTIYETPQGIYRLAQASGSTGYLRFAGGAAVLCRTLTQRLPANCLQLSTHVTAIRQLPDGQGVEVRAVQGDSTCTYIASAVVVALPPRLIAHSIQFEPALPTLLHQTLRTVPTWMSHAMKSVVVYEQPFWRAHSWSGFAVSQVGPLLEIHDASPENAQLGALFGFFATPHPLRTASLMERKAAVLAQLTRLFGPQAAHPLAYHELDWAQEPFTSVPGDEQLPLQVPLQGPELLRQPIWQGTLLWAGAETSLGEWGRLNGAIESGRWAAKQVLQQLKEAAAPVPKTK